MEVLAGDLWLAALNSLGQLPDGITLDELDARLTRRVALLMAARNPASCSVKVMEALPLVGRIESVTIEGQSNRALIAFKARNSDSPETIRSCRLETQVGRQVAKTASECIGRYCMISKVLEAANGGAGKKVRIAYDVRPLGKPDGGRR